MTVAKLLTETTQGSVWVLLRMVGIKFLTKATHRRKDSFWLTVGGHHSPQWQELGVSVVRKGGRCKWPHSAQPFERPTLRVTLPTLANNPHSQAQKCVSLAMLELATVTVSINHCRQEGCTLTWIFTGCSLSPWGRVWRIGSALLTRRIQGLVSSSKAYYSRPASAAQASPPKDSIIAFKTAQAANGAGGTFLVRP